MKRRINSPIDRLVLIIVLLLVLIMAVRTPVDSDLWWHLKAGEWSWQHTQPITQDAFSHTSLGASWINHSWLSELFFYGVYSLAGFPGLGVTVALLAMLSIFFVFIQMEGNVFNKAFILVLVAAVAGFVWSPRPQMFSLLFFAVEGWILHQFKWYQKRNLWVLPILFMFWGNLHGGYPLGLLLIAGTLAGETLNHFLGFEGREVYDWHEIFELGGWGLLSVLALLINPNGINILIVPFQTVGTQVLQRFIQEWASPDFHEVSQQVMLLLFFLIIFFIGISGRRLDGTDAVVLIVFSYLAFVARRNFGPFALAAAPILSRHLQPAMDAWISRIKSKTVFIRFMEKNISLGLNSGNSSFSPRIQVIVNLILLVSLGSAFLIKLYWVSSPEMVNQAISQYNSPGAVEWMLKNRPAGKLLNEYNAGGYLIWSLKEYPVFVDGRTDMYGDTVLKDWLTLVGAETGWQELMKKYGIEVVMLNPGKGLVKVLQAQGWQKTYEDQQAVILIPAKP